MRTNQTNEHENLDLLCKAIREYMEEYEYEKCEEYIKNAMCEYPHSPVPHNLMGILLERWSDSVSAMKHFRAAYALDPSYRPARCNMDKYAGFDDKGKTAYTEEDCPEEKLWKRKY